MDHHQDCHFSLCQSYGLDHWQPPLLTYPHQDRRWHHTHALLAQVTGDTSELRRNHLSGGQDTHCLAVISRQHCLPNSPRPSLQAGNTASLTGNRPKTASGNNTSFRTQITLPWTPGQLSLTHSFTTTCPAALELSFPGGALEDYYPFINACKAGRCFPEH